MEATERCEILANKWPFHAISLYRREFHCVIIFQCVFLQVYHVLVIKLITFDFITSRMYTFAKLQQNDGKSLTENSSNPLSSNFW